MIVSITFLVSTFTEQDQAKATWDDMPAKEKKLLKVLGAGGVAVVLWFILGSTIPATYKFVMSNLPIYTSTVPDMSDREFTACVYLAIDSLEAQDLAAKLDYSIPREQAIREKRKWTEISYKNYDEWDRKCGVKKLFEMGVEIKTGGPIPSNPLAWGNIGGYHR